MAADPNLVARLTDLLTNNPALLAETSKQLISSGVQLPHASSSTPSSLSQPPQPASAAPTASAGASAATAAAHHHAVHADYARAQAAHFAKHAAAGAGAHQAGPPPGPPGSYHHPAYPHSPVAAAVAGPAGYGPGGYNHHHGPHAAAAAAAAHHHVTAAAHAAAHHAAHLPAGPPGIGIPHGSHGPPGTPTTSASGPAHIAAHHHHHHQTRPAQHPVNTQYGVVGSSSTSAAAAAAAAYHHAHAAAAHAGGPHAATAHHATAAAQAAASAATYKDHAYSRSPNKYGDHQTQNLPGGPHKYAQMPGPTTANVSNNYHSPQRNNRNSWNTNNWGYGSSNNWDSRKDYNSGSNTYGSNTSLSPNKKPNYNTNKSKNNSSSTPNHRASPLPPGLTLDHADEKTVKLGTSYASTVLTAGSAAAGQEPKGPLTNNNNNKSMSTGQDSNTSGHSRVEALQIPDRMEPPVQVTPYDDDDIINIGGHNQQSKAGGHKKTVTIDSDLKTGTSPIHHGGGHGGVKKISGSESANTSTNGDHISHGVTTSYGPTHDSSKESVTSSQQTKISGSQQQQAAAQVAAAAQGQGGPPQHINNGPPGPTVTSSSTTTVTPTSSTTSNSMIKNPYTNQVSPLKEFVPGKGFCAAAATANNGNNVDALSQSGSRSSGRRPSLYDSFNKLSSSKSNSNHNGSNNGTNTHTAGNGIAPNGNNNINNNVNLTNSMNNNNLNININQNNLSGTHGTTNNHGISDNGMDNLSSSLHSQLIPPSLSGGDRNNLDGTHQSVASVNNLGGSTSGNEQSNMSSTNTNNTLQIPSSSIETLIENNGFFGKIQKIAQTSQPGCRLLQKKIFELDGNDLQRFVKEVTAKSNLDKAVIGVNGIITQNSNTHEPVIVQLMIHPLGNYLSQRIFDATAEMVAKKASEINNESGDENIKKECSSTSSESQLSQTGCSVNLLNKLLDCVAPHFIKICTNTHGSRSVQHLIDVVADTGNQDCFEAFKSCFLHQGHGMNKSNSTRQGTMISSLTGKPISIDPIVEIVTNGASNHVLQKCLLVFGSHPKSTSIDKQFFLRLLTGKICELACQKHGCCVLQRVLDACNPEGGCSDEFGFILEEILDDIKSVCESAYGNYVVQYIMKQGIGSGQHTNMLQLEAQKESNEASGSISDIDNKDKLLEQQNAKKDQQSSEPGPLPENHPGHPRNNHAVAFFTRRVVEILAESPAQFVHVCCQKFSSNVIECALQHSAGQCASTRALILENLIPRTNPNTGRQDFSLLSIVLCDKFGNYIVQRALEMAHAGSQQGVPGYNYYFSQLIHGVKVILEMDVNGAVGVRSKLTKRWYPMLQPNLQ